MTQTKELINSNSGDCHNCGYKNQKNAVYCAQCSQKTHLPLLSVRVMLSQFVANIFNYDSKILTTIRGLFNPGFLTQQYLANKRVAYLSPIRLFIFLMFAFFAVLSFQDYDQLILNTNNDFDTSQNDSQDDMMAQDKTYFNLLEQNYIALRYDRLISLLRNELIQQQLQADELLQKLEKNKEKNLELKISERKEINQDIESIEASLKSLETIRASIELEQQKTVNITLLFDRQYEFHIHDLNKLSSQQLIEKYQINHWLEQIMVKQYLKFNTDHKAFGKFIFQNLTWVIIIEVLLMSLFFKIFYIRRARKYVEYFVFHLHIRSFLFLIGIGVFLFPYELAEVVVTIIFCLLLIYVWLAMYRIMQQHWFMTGIKFAALSLIEMFVFILSFVVVVIGSSFIY